MKAVNFFPFSMMAGAVLLINSDAMAQNNESKSLLIFPGIWKADMIALNHAEQTAEKKGTDLMCVSNAVTSENDLQKTFLQKFLERQCSVTPLKGGYEYGVWMYEADMTCGAMSGPVKISGVEDKISVSVKLMGEIGGVQYGKDTSMKYEWTHVSDTCQ